MKKWEEQQKNKIYQSRIKNVKPAVSNTGVRKSGNKSLNDSRQISQIKSPVQGVVTENQNQISDYYDSEKNNLQSIPLYRILKLQSLQQYAKELISRGFGYDLKKFNYLSQQQLDALLNDIRVLPGHKTKLIDLLDLVSNEMIPEIENNSMWNVQSPGSGSGQYYNPIMQSSGKSMNKANSAKIVSTKLNNNNNNNNNNINNQMIGKLPATTRNNYDKQHSNTSHNFLRKNSQPQVSSTAAAAAGGGGRNNHHMYYQGNQRQIKSHTSHVKKRSGQNIGYDYFIDSQDENDGYDEFQEAIESLVNQYNFANNRTIYKEQHQTDESFKNELNELDLEFELEQNIGYKNHAQMRAKLDKAINQANKQPNSKAYTNNSSGNSLASQGSSQTQTSKNASLANTKANTISQTISNSSIGQQKITTTTISTSSTTQKTLQIQSLKPIETQVKPSSSSQLQRRPSSGIQKQPGSQQSSAPTQALKETHSRGGSTSSSSSVVTSNLKANNEKEQPKPVKKTSQIVLPSKQQEEEKVKDVQKAKQLDSKQKLEIEKLKLKSSEGSRPLAQTSKELANQLNQQNQVQQNSSGLHKKTRPQTAKYARTSSQVQDDQCLIPEYDENDNLILLYKENRLIKNLRKNASQKNDQSHHDELNPQLDFDTIKQMYMSFDGGRLTSTLVNLDIEEMCFCFACVILKHIERGEEVDKIIQNNKTFNKLHAIKEEHEDHQQNSSKKANQNDSSCDNTSSVDDAQLPSHNYPQTYLQPTQQNHLYNDTSLNRTTNPIEEPTMIQDDYNQSIINADAEKYLKDDDTEYRSGDRKYPQEFRVNDGEYNWKQKNSLSDISERTHEVSHQNNKSITVDQSNEQSLNLRNNLTNANSRKQFEQSRQEMEEILKESLLMNVRDNHSLRRRLGVENNHDDEKEFEYTENEDEEEESHQDMNPVKRKGFASYKNEIGHSKTPFEESSLNQFQYENLEKGQHSEEEDNEFLSKIQQQKDKSRGQQQGRTFNEDQEKTEQYEQNSFNKDYNEENYDEVESEGEIENDHQDEEITKNEHEGVEGESQLSFSTISRYSIVIPNDENSNKRLFDKTYNFKENSDQIFTQKPTKETIQNYCKNVCISCQLEKQIPIIALVYIERLLKNSGFTVTSKNWRKITITSMIMASKIWDDESFENKNFSQAFPQFDVIQINEMERVFLNFLDYNLYIKGADYAKYYFILREFAQKNKKSFPLRPLDLKTILQLQNNANRAQSNLKEMYQNPLNKSF